MIIEVTGSPSKVNPFLEIIEEDGYEIAELARTGLTGLSRGTFDVKVPHATFDETGKLVYYDDYEPEFN